MYRDLEELKELDLYVGRRLRERRSKLNMTLVQVAEKIGVSHQQIQKYEQSQTRISAPTLYQLSHLYGVQPQFFFEGFDNFIKKKNYKNGYLEPNTKNELNILLVEDDPSDELFIRKSLEGYEHKTNIFSVHDGIQALEFLRNKNLSADFPRPDLIFLDIDVPKKDGLSVLKDIKRDRSLLDIPVIVFVNTINIDSLTNVYNAYASGYVCKADKTDEFKKRMQCLVKYWSQSVILPHHHPQEDINYLLAS